MSKRLYTTSDRQNFILGIIILIIHCDSLLANYWFSVVTSHVIEAWRPLDNDCQTVLIPLCIVWLAGAPSRQCNMHHLRVYAHSK